MDNKIKFKKTEFQWIERQTFRKISAGIKFDATQIREMVGSDSEMVVNEKVGSTIYRGSAIDRVLAEMRAF